MRQGSGLPPRRAGTARSRRRARRTLVLAAALLALAPAPRARAEELLVAAAVSLRAPLREIAADYRQAHPEDAPRLSFGASSALAVQLRLGAPIDVLLSADARIARALGRAGILAPESLVAFAGNALVAVARKGFRAPADADPRALFARADRVALPAPAVPLGRYAREWLAARGLLAGLAGREIATEHSRATLAAVESGHADLALVYATDARLARSARVVFVVPASEQPEIAYVGGRAASLPLAKARAADHFLAALREPPARAVLRRAGFRVEPPPAKGRLRVEPPPARAD